MFKPGEASLDASSPRVDPVTLEIVRNGLKAVATRVTIDQRVAGNDSCPRCETMVMVCFALPL